MVKAKTAAIYCRVSTETQEREGTSLETQLQGCLQYCEGKGYNVAYRFSEAYSGLNLERPKLDELRELVRNEVIDIVVCYSLDRLTRDPGHGVIITQETEKHGVKLEAVTEDVDNSELGKLISYIRGYASKLEAEKIRERTMRGKRARAREGRILGGGSSRIYGYDYIKVADKNGGRRIINENEAKWVCQIYEWLVNDGISTTAITKRLRALNAPTKTGKPWAKQTISAILKNPAYTAKTYAFTTSRRGKPFTKPRGEWIEIPGEVTPRIINDALFEAAQNQLKLNGARAIRNCRREYLLRSHIFCRLCGRSYCGHTKTKYAKGKRYEARRYKCCGTRKIDMPINTCANKSWSADKLEALVWAQIERVLANPELIIAEIEKQRQDANQLGALEAELQQLERQLRALDRDQKELLDNALRGFPESLIISENKKINSKRESLQSQKAELEARAKTCQESANNLPNMERFVELIRQKLIALDYETKRQVLDMLSIKVWIDGCNVEITGCLPILEGDIVTMQSW